ncbi:hypothetical protein PsYK624_040270 [Phanerochaete sordida]|uniref:Uncharacterized protein n=1 Tax=Phanerochaete sordida TaxID=48140 RepID=A0A9P3G4Y6_9APHY|nr:hypothetical protein PsYK624_040270 [Phanerochaete sordida]
MSGLITACFTAALKKILPALRHRLPLTCRHYSLTFLARNLQHGGAGCSCAPRVAHGRVDAVPDTMCGQDANVLLVLTFLRGLQTSRTRLVSLCPNAARNPPLVQ